MLRQLSAKRMYVARWLPVFVTGLILAWMWAAELAKPTPDVVSVLTVSAIVVGILLWVQVRGSWRHLNQVLDGGDFLIVRKGREEDRVALSNISAMFVSNNFGATTIVLHLSIPSKFGSKISFLADSMGIRWTTSPVAAELEAKIRKVSG